MSFQIGDKVIHSVFGLGDVVKIVDKLVRDQNAQYYEVRTRDLTIWVPIQDEERHTLRLPTSKNEFKKLFSVLQSPSEPLPDDRIERKKLLLSLLRDGQLASICRVVRDLSGHGHKAKLGDEEKLILERAKNTLLTEWEFSLAVPLMQARQKMGELLNP